MPRYKRRKWRRYLILFSMMCGAIYYADVRYAFFMLREIEVTPGNMIPEEAIWQALPSNAEGFWPFLAFGRGNFEKKITHYYPVSMKMTMAGWGKYKVTVAPLDIFIAVTWDSKLWWMSSDGKMWLANLPSSVRVKGLVYPDKPILSWDSELPTPIDPERQIGDIYLSSLPIAKIKKWYDTIEKIDWNKDIYCLMAKKIDGNQVVQILLGNKELITGEIILKEDASDWLSLAAALEKKGIYSGASGGFPPGLTINATYADMTFSVSERGKM